MTEPVLHRTEHATSVRFFREFDAWSAACSCGWTGTYWRLRASAQEEAREHRA
jgi:hypothetical protein